jgi:hypothetical membrane protein
VLIAAAMIPVFLTVGYLIAGARQPESYSPVRQSVSVLAGHGGTDRWLMTGALLLIGGLYAVCGLGLRAITPATRVLLLISAAAGIGIAVCPEPAVGSTIQHSVCTAVGELSLAALPLVAGIWGLPDRVLSRRASAAGFVLFLGLLGWLVLELVDGPQLGLAERVASSVQTCWPFVVGVALYRAQRPVLERHPQPGWQSAWSTQER